jgi:hypothetical protein
MQKLFVNQVDNEIIDELDNQEDLSFDKISISKAK